VRILSAAEEARLAFAGAVAAAEPKAGLVAVVDLGGASTEIAVGRPESGPAWLRSVDMGALRLTTGYLDTDSPGRGDVAAGRAAVAEAFAGVTPPLPGGALVVGGSARALRRVAGPRLGPDELAHAVDLLARCRVREVARRYDVGKRRAPLLLAAALILEEVQRRLFVPLEVVRGGLREGALLEALEAEAA
jgi:exopolyphosphatase/guanosine-5'-triphosphate,3'-diphosphate pyrophosphatase